MINLLPSDNKEHYVYARRNTSLRRWVVALVIGLVGVGLVTTGGMIVMQRSIDDYSHKVVVAREELKDQKLEETRKHAKEITDSLKLVVDVLSREVLFSKLLTQLGVVTPTNVSLQDLSISQVQGALDITAVSTDYASATQLHVNLQDQNNKIFSRADLQTINCSSAVSVSRYPCTVTIRALFNQDNPFLFINKNKPPAGSIQP